MGNDKVSENPLNLGKMSLMLSLSGGSLFGVSFLLLYLISPWVSQQGNPILPMALLSVIFIAVLSSFVAFVVGVMGIIKQEKKTLAVYGVSVSVVESIVLFCYLGYLATYTH